MFFGEEFSHLASADYFRGRSAKQVGPANSRLRFSTRRQFSCEKGLNLARDKFVRSYEVIILQMRALLAGSSQ